MVKRTKMRVGHHRTDSTTFEKKMGKGKLEVKIDCDPTGRYEYRARRSRLALGQTPSLRPLGLWGDAAFRGGNGPPLGRTPKDRMAASKEGPFETNTG